MTVEEAQVIDTGGSVEVQTPSDPYATDSQAAEHADMEAAWAKIHTPEGVDRGEDGKFVSKTPQQPEDGSEVQTDTQTAELEGAAEGGDTEGQSTVPDVPLPSNLYGLDAEWAALPPDVRQKFAERSNELNTRMSDMGRQVAASKALNDAAGEFAEYFNSNLTGPDGNPITPADGLRYLANIQRQMDQNPVQTLLSIADTYGIREHVAKALGTQAAPQQPQQVDPNRLSEIARQEARKEAARVAQEQAQASLQREGQRMIDADADIKNFVSNSPQRWAVFVNEGVVTLGENASLEAIFKYAKDQAIEADPTLRSKRDAAAKAASDKATKAEAAKRANGVNVTSTSTGKSRPMTDDEAMEAAWNQIQASA